MTVIAAMVHDGRVWMAADSGATSSGDGQRWPNIRKITRLPLDDGTHALIGCAGMVSFSQLFANGVITITDGPRGSRDADVWAYTVAQALTEVAATSKPSLVSDEGGLNGEFLLAHKGRLWALDANSALRVNTYAAIGSGSGYAMGAMHALFPKAREDRLLGGSDTVRRACQAAIQWCVTCHGKINIEAT